MKKTHIGNLLLLLAAMIWGFAFVAQVVSVESGIGAVSFNAVRFLIGGLALIPIIFIFNRKKDKNESIDSTSKANGRRCLIIGSLVSGLFLAAAANLQQYALTFNANPGFAGFITALYTVWTPVAYFLIFKKKTAVSVWIAVAISLFGFYLLCMTDGGRISFGLDVILLLISTLFWTAQILAVDYFVTKADPLKLSCGQYLVCAILSFVYVLFFEREGLTLSAVDGAKWSILYCGLLSVGVAYTLQVVGQKLTNPVFAVIIMSLESVFSAVGGVLWNLITPEALHVSQNISLVGYIGCAVIFAGVVVSQVDFSEVFIVRKDKSL